LGKNSDRSDVISLVRYILSKKEKRKAERMQRKYRKEFRKHSPVLLWAQLRALFTDRSNKQAQRDTEFLLRNEEDHPKEV
jgi:hypothetical protein